MSIGELGLSNYRFGVTEVVKNSSQPIWEEIISFELPTRPKWGAGATGQRSVGSGRSHATEQSSRSGTKSGTRGERIGSITLDIRVMDKDESMMAVSSH